MILGIGINSVHGLREGIKIGEGMEMGMDQSIYKLKG